MEPALRKKGEREQPPKHSFCRKSSYCHLTKQMSLECALEVKSGCLTLFPGLPQPSRNPLHLCFLHLSNPTAQAPSQMGQESNVTAHGKVLWELQSLRQM